MTRELCPICNSSNVLPTIHRDALVTMQNYVYHHANEAQDAKIGEFLLTICSQCGFAYNSCFDKKLMQYDENYNNSVPSRVFESYYQEIASFLYEEFPIKNGTVIDIGCGKGHFLRTLCAKYPDITGIGIDPSYERTVKDIDGEQKCYFIDDIFKADYVKQKPNLVICRHVIEHIYHPVVFLKQIHLALNKFQNIPVFIEVPDLKWILDNNAFWDFCYEHCNYFTADSLSHTLERAGFSVEKTYSAFNNQYLWLKSTTKSMPLTTYKGWKDTTDIIEHLKSYIEREKELIDKVRSTLLSIKEKQTIVIWGMSTKGVVFSNLLDPTNCLIDYCVDINTSKQYCFVPHTAHKIYPPEVLQSNSQNSFVIIVMNPNYLDEIKTKCRELSLDANFLDANMTQL
ncbi:C-methyltransferase [Beggiatoa alba B18LD]|uniref:C-methyltransferase n=1 Tax=Beggiatoa alba B18LD TaxID=395493 RepID=I3CHN1_9GAMM|nr:class I SAM-dependent methyltransferase [Beggiatoa alba]EIJ43124.1 C-methyltransferase [Beggiatoa alba B18LD]